MIYPPHLARWLAHHLVVHGVTLARSSVALDVPAICFPDVVSALLERHYYKARRLRRLRRLSRALRRVRFIRHQCRVKSTSLRRLHRTS